MGLGAMGQRHARVLAALPDRFEIVGAHDPRAGAPTPAGIARLSSEDEGIHLAEVLLVATPVETHGPIAARALAAGRHVLVEKPLCATGAAASALALAARGGARLFVGHTERFNPVVRALARLVRAGRDDDVIAMDFRRVGPSRPSGCGALVNLAVHDFDLAAYLGGSEITLRAALGGRSSATPDEDFAHCLFTSAAGAIGHLFVDRASPERHRSLLLQTSQWVYEGDLLAHRLLRTPRARHGQEGGHGAGAAARVDVPLSLEEPLLAQAVALADALSGRPSREIATGADGARSVSLSEQASLACLRSEPAERVKGARAPG